MPKVSDTRRQAQYQRILDAASLCFQQKGFQATTMNDVIRAAGLSAGAVYGYVASKQDLILATMDVAMVELYERLEPVIDQAPLEPYEFAQAILRELQKPSTRKDVSLDKMAVLATAEAVRDPDFAAALRGRLARLIERVALRCPNGDPDTRSFTANLILTLVYGTIMRHAIFQDGLFLPQSSPLKVSR